MAAVDELERGREAYAQRAWRDAYGALAGAATADDLELLATAAYMLGRDDEHLAALERAHHAHVEAGNLRPAVRCAFWLGVTCRIRGEGSRGSGWSSRARRLLERAPGDGPERGYLRMPVPGSGLDDAAARDAAAESAAIGERFGDRDLVALALQEQGHALIRLGAPEEGLRLLDEAMVAVTAGELSPIVTGLVYCGVIDGCRQAHSLRRAREWTEALTTWCDRQPDVVAFTGRCLIHRAEIMQMHGEWPDALKEARRAALRLERAGSRAAAAQAFYRQGELHRLRGEPAAAERAYREASRCGAEPQPGLALLRLAQGRPDAAAAAIERTLGETDDGQARAALLPAAVDIALEAGDLDAAERACAELETLAAGRADALSAMAAQARGAVALAAGEPRPALAALRRAAEAWSELDAAYETARVRELVGLACRALGDEDSAALELEAARTAFAALGAAPDAERLPGAGRRPGQLTARELQVLRLVAAGETNRAIAAELVLSERTVDRHVSNIFAKLGASSRAAATAAAYERRLV